MADNEGYVKKETTLLIALGAVVAGFLAGIAFSALQGPATAPVQTASAPPAGAGASFSPDQANAILNLEKEVAANPRNAAAWVQLGNTWFDSNNPAKAIEAYEKALAIKPGDPNVLTDLGVMYRRNGQPLEAIKRFDLANAADPNHAISLFNKGIVQIFDLKDMDAGLASWETLVKLNPAAKAPDGRLISEMIKEFRAKKQ